MKLKLGDAIIVRTNQDYNGSRTHAAIVTRVWGAEDTRNGPQSVNCMAQPDGSTPFPMMSVLVYDIDPQRLDPNIGWLPRAAE